MNFILNNFNYLYNVIIRLSYLRFNWILYSYNKFIKGFDLCEKGF